MDHAITSNFNIYFFAELLLEFLKQVRKNYVIRFSPLLWLLPTYVGSDYIWHAFPLAEGVTAIGLVIATNTLKVLSPFKDISTKLNKKSCSY